MPGGTSRLAAVFISTVIVRNILESVANGMIFPPEAFLLHFPVAYVFPMLGIVAAMHLVSGYPVTRLMKLMVWAWTLTILPPLLDAAMGTGSPIGYFPLDASNARHFIVNFFNPAAVLPGTTTGIRIEAAAGCLLGGLFIGNVSRSALRGAAGALLLAPLFLVFFGWPGILHWLTGRFFPYAGGIQDFLQWHSFTRPHLVNSVHMTVYLADIWPVTLIGAWLVARSGDAGRREIALAAGSCRVTAAAALAGTAAVAACALRAQTVTFADAATLAGALLSGLALSAAPSLGGLSGAAALIIAMSTAAATGWPTLAAALAAATLPRTVPDGRIRTALLAPLVLAVAASPVFTSPVDLLSILPLLAASIILGAVPAGGRPWIVLRPLPLLLPVFAILLGAEPEVPAQQAWLAETTDSFTRSTRNSHASVSASLLAAEGGSTVPLAQSAQLMGRADQAEWLSSLASLDGTGGSGMLQVAVNLAMQDGDREELVALLSTPGVDEGDRDRIIQALAGSAASTGDTLLLREMIGYSAPDAMHLRYWSRALLALGDTSSAAGFAAAALQAPGAGPGEYAMAASLAAATGSDYESMIDEGVRRFGNSRELDLCAVRSSLVSGRLAAAEGSVARMLGTRPPTSESLDACARWLLEAGLADSALSVAEKALMMQYPPAAGSLELAVACAEAAGDTARAGIHRRYLTNATGPGLRIPKAGVHEGDAGQGTQAGPAGPERQSWPVE